MSFSDLNENYISVATLPANLAPISRPSKPIKRLLAKRAKGHNILRNTLKLDLEKINVEIEDAIRDAHQHFVETFEKLQQKVELEANRIFGEQLADLRDDIWETVLPIVQNLNNQRLEEVENFYHILKNFESLKLKKIKKVLQQNYKKMEQVAFLSPFELLEFFENESLKINEISMSNQRHYSDIYTKLKLQILEEMRHFNLMFIQTKEKYKMAIANISSVLVEKQQDDLVLPSITSQTPQEVELWTKEMNEKLMNLDSESKKLINLFKTAIFNVFNRFFEDLESVNLKLYDSLSKSNETVDSFLPYQSMIAEVTETYNCDFEELQILWSEIIDYMENDLEKTRSFLNSCAHLWDDHFEREKQIKSVILIDLKLEIDKNDRSSRSHDKKINTILDKLREASNLKQLEKHLKNSNKLLDSVQKLYSSQCDNEIKILAKFQNLTNQSIDLLISEIDRFLDENLTLDNKKLNDDYRIPYQIEKCQYQVNAVHNWMFGLWEAIKSYMHSCHKEMSNKANLWIEHVTINLKKRLEFRLSTLNVRYERIKLLFDARLQEIQKHEEDFGIYEKKLDKHLETNCNPDCHTILETFYNQINQIELELQETVNSLQVSVCIEKVKMAAAKTQILLDSNIDENWQKLEKNHLETDKLVNCWNESLKLFIDGGSYSRDEAKAYLKKIQKITKTVPAKIKMSQNDFERDKNDILEQFENSKQQILRRLESYRSEFENNEKTCEKIKLCQTLIRNNAYEMKYLLHRTKLHIDEFLQNRKKFQTCSEKLQELCDYLTDEENGYFNRIIKIIEKSFNEIENEAKIFYTNHGEIQNLGKIQKNLDLFVNEVAKNYDAFKIQIKIHFWKSFDEFVAILIEFVKVSTNDNQCTIVDDLMKDFLKDEGRLDAVRIFMQRLLDFLNDPETSLQ